MKWVMDICIATINILGGIYLYIEKPDYLNDFFVVAFIVIVLRISATQKGLEYWGKFGHVICQIPQNIYIQIWKYWPLKKGKNDIKQFFEKIIDEEKKQLEPDLPIHALIIHIEENYSNKGNNFSENWQPIAQKLRSGELKCWGKLCLKRRRGQWISEIGGEKPIKKELWKIRELLFMAKYSTIEGLFDGSIVPFTHSSPDINGQERFQITEIRVNESQIKKFWPKNWDNFQWSEIFVKELKEKNWVEKELTRRAELIDQLGGINPPS